MVFERAWCFLKESRQTELGEFHPDFPSSYGPMTAISNQFTQRHFDDFKMNYPQNFDESMAQPYEAFVHEGLKAKPASKSSLEWEQTGIEWANKPNPHHDAIGVKPFDLRERKGNWFAPASNYRDYVRQRNLGGVTPKDMGFNHPDSRVVGIRMPLDASMGQFRDRGYSGEGAEAFIEGDIPPERLVMVPKMMTHRRGQPWPGGLGEVDE